MQIVIGYKIVTYNFNSIIADGTKHSIQYLKNQWVYPRIGKIFIFDSINNSCKFMGNDREDILIFKCAAINIIKPKFILSACYSTDDVYNFWHNKTGFTMLPPPGTLCADAIYLLRRVR